MEEAAQAAVIDETKRKEAADRHEKLLNSLKAFIYSNKKFHLFLYQLKYFHQINTRGGDNFQLYSSTAAK